MFFNADIARLMARRYEQKIARARLKYIIKSIEVAAAQGYDALRWPEKVEKGNIYKLRKLHFKVTPLKNGGIDIEW